MWIIYGLNSFSIANLIRPGKEATNFYLAWKFFPDTHRRVQSFSKACTLLKLPEYPILDADTPAPTPNAPMKKSNNNRASKKTEKSSMSTHQEQSELSHEIVVRTSDNNPPNPAMREKYNRTGKPSGPIRGASPFKLH